MSMFTDIIPIIPERRPRERIIEKIVVGDGKEKSMRVNRQGIALGGKTWDTSPFRVDMQGNVVMNNVIMNDAVINNATAYNLTITGTDPSKWYLGYVAINPGNGNLVVRLPNGNTYQLPIVG